MHNSFPPAEIIFDKVSLTEFRLEEDSNEFLQLILKYLPIFYDDVDASFGESILTTYRLGYDPHGHFTERKIVYRISYEKNKVGYVVVTEKRGQCVKIGPTILYENWRSKGVGTYVRKLIRDLYAAKGFRKAYSTVADNKIDSYKYLIKSGYTIEAHLKSHYKKEHGELVFGQFLTNEYVQVSNEYQYKKVQKFEIINHTGKFKAEVFDFIYNNMQDSFLINEKFVEDLFLAEERGQDEFHLKGKTIFIAVTEKREICAVAITTYKRGGAVKVAPFLTSSLDVVAEMLTNIVNYYRNLDCRKLMILVPSSYVRLRRVLNEFGFEKEGVLKEPYKRGVDMNVMSLFIQERKIEDKPQALLSILPDPVGRIINGKKFFEMRKMLPKTPLNGVYLYSTGDERAIMGYIEVIGYFKNSIDTLWAIVGEYGAPQKRFRDYFGNYKVGYGIAISKVCVFDTPIPLKQIRSIDPSFNVPMQFSFFKNHSVLEKFLDEKRKKGRWFETGVEKIIEPYKSLFTPY